MIQGARVADVRGALLHFKFLDDFAANVQTEIAREQYWNKAQEYKGYGAVLSQNSNVNFMSPISEKFVNSSQLVTLGVMKTSARFVEYRRTRQRERFSRLLKKDLQLTLNCDLNSCAVGGTAGGIDA